jgi:hypothetical protein
MAALTNIQIWQLAQAQNFQARVQAAIVAQAGAILDNVRQTGTTGPGGVAVEGQTPVYTVAQQLRAYSIAQGQSLTQYYLLLAGAANVVGATLLTNSLGVPYDSAVIDAALNSQVMTTVFEDAV